MITEFSPYASLLGGIIIGVASVLLMAIHGRIAGISGIAVQMFPPYLTKGTEGYVAFIVGIILAPLLYATVTGAWPEISITSNTTALLVGGVLVGFGSVLGNGCTSGHGVCGLARLSKRSFTAVATFMATAIITVFIVRHIV